MTSTLVHDAPAAAPASTVRQLARLEARRFGRHPLFLVGVLFSVITMVAIADDRSPDSLTNGVIPSFFLGVLSMVVSYRLTRSTAPAAEAVDAAPTSGTTRTAALCLAGLVPAAAGVVWLAVMYVVFAVWPPDAWAWATFDAADRLAIFTAQSAVAGLGAALLGVVVARWLRFPGAIVLAVVVLLAWVLSAQAVAAVDAPSTLGAALRMTAPFTVWTSVDPGSASIDTWLGSPAWHLLYLLTLCALAATAAMLRDAAGRTRVVLLRVGGACAVVAVLAALAATTGGIDEPTRTSRDGSTSVVSEH
ncbi:MAG TPA: hypothetical protein VNU26_16135 [Mycobacteriales bacterium]|nr:hypothetical protein [Mycobacteriales bacterium]